MRRALERADGIVVCGEAGSIAEARAVMRKEPTVAIVDVRLPDGSGIDFCRELRATAPEVAVVILTMYGDDSYLLAARDAGASTFITKDSPAREIVAAVRTAAATPATFAAAGLTEALARAGDTQVPILTPREREVLTLVAEGLSVAGISRRLYISESTTKTHIAKIYVKLGASNRAQAVVKALRYGLVSTAD